MASDLLQLAMDGFGGDQKLMASAGVASVMGLVSCVWIYVTVLSDASSKKPFLDKKRKSVKVESIEELSHDTKLIRLNLNKQRLGLPVGQHFKIFCPNPNKGGETWNGRPDNEAGRDEIERQYTPVTGDDTVGFVDLVIKMYRPGKVTMPDGKQIEWQDGGRLTMHLDQLKAGDFMDINGPFGLITYKGRGGFKLPGQPLPRVFKQVGMMAGGSGITPMLQIVQAAIKDPADKTEFHLLYANKTEDDILCRALINQLVFQAKGRFTASYTLDFPPKGASWAGVPGRFEGFITQDMIAKTMPKCEGSDNLVLMCGPPPMVEFACKKNLLEMGWGKENLAVF